MRVNLRLDTVEKAIRESSWTEAVIQDLLKSTGASRASLYRDRNVVLAKLAKEEAAGLEERRASFLLDLRRVQRKAVDAGAYSPASRLLDMESRILGLDRVPLPDVTDETDTPLDTSLESVLGEVRKMRRQAQAGCSYVAADKLLEREHAIVESIRLRDEAKASADMMHLDESALVEMVCESVATLPDSLKDRLRAALGGS